MTALTGRRSIADLLWVANTRHGPAGHWFARATRDDGDHDHLATVSDAVRYLADHGVEVPSAPPVQADLDALAAIRDMVRDLGGPHSGWTPGVLRILSMSRFQLDELGSLTAVGGSWKTFAGELMLPLLEVLRVRDRVVACANPSCRLVFVDGSKSGTRRWCDDAGCGNRDRVKRHRRRERAIGNGIVLGQANEQSH